MRRSHGNRNFANYLRAPDRKMLATQATPRKDEQATSTEKPQILKRSMGLTNLQHHKGLGLTTAAFDRKLNSNGFNTSLTVRYRLADAGCATALRGLLRHKIRVAKCTSI